MKPIQIPKTEIKGARELTPSEMNAIHFASGNRSERPATAK